jgi:hypothetical protein
MFKRKLVATAAMASCLVGLGVGSAVPASASTSKTSVTSGTVPQTMVTPPGCPDGGWGGLKICDSPTLDWEMPDGRWQTFVIGTDYAVWTRWQLPGGGMSDWTSMGGQVAAYDIGVWYQGGTGWALTIKVVGTDGNFYYLDRQGIMNGSWDNWHR